MIAIMLNIRNFLGDKKRFGELFTADAIIEIPKAKVKKQGTQEIESKGWASITKLSKNWDYCDFNYYSRFITYDFSFFFTKDLCNFLHQKFSGCTHWEGNIVLKKKLANEKLNNEGISHKQKLIKLK